MRMDFILKGSVISEKSYSLNEKGLYVLKVATKASKEDIRNALKAVFGVDTVQINTSIVRGRVVRKARGKKTAPIEVKLANFKKAYVKLKAGQVLPAPTIDPVVKAGGASQVQSADV